MNDDAQIKIECLHTEIEYVYMAGGPKEGMATRCQLCGEDIDFVEMDFPEYFEHQRKQAEQNDTGE